MKKPARRISGRWLVVFFAVLVWVGSSAFAGRLPNVVFIISDDHAWSDYGFMGHRQITTPALDRLAAQSLVFERGYSPVPLCRPALASIVTGLYPSQHGVTGNDPALPGQVNPQQQRQNPVYADYYAAMIGQFASRPNLVRDLVGNGYVALQTGKWWEGDPVKTAGFTHAMTVGEAKGSRHGDAGLLIGRQGLGAIKNFIQDAGTNSFFVWYAPMLPHSPHNPPQELLNKHLKAAPSESVARYWACVEWFDRTCGELLDYLERQNLRSNTIVIYTTDNGYIPRPDKVNQPAPRSKLTPYEGGVRTPIMISWPGKLKPRRDRDHLATNLDLWPTLASLLRLDVPASLPGVDLTSRRAVSRRQRTLGEHYAHDVADVKEPTRSLQNRWIIDGWWKLILPDERNLPNRRPELYNLRNDPWELTDCAATESARVKKLRSELQQCCSDLTRSQPSETKHP